MKFFKKPSPLWLVILSEFFVNLGAGWFGVVLFDPNLSTVAIRNWGELTIKLLFGILSLLAGKTLREEAKKWKL